jgi:hypothetical protein
VSFSSQNMQLRSSSLLYGWVRGAWAAALYLALAPGIMSLLFLRARKERSPVPGQLVVQALGWWHSRKFVPAAVVSAVSVLVVTYQVGVAVLTSTGDFDGAFVLLEAEVQYGRR